MKIYAYEVRQDEMDYFKEYEKKYGVSVVLGTVGEEGSYVLYKDKFLYKEGILCVQI